MTADLEFLTLEEVEALHDEQLRLFGGLAGTRDRAALESAIAMPASSFDGAFLHGDVFEMAARFEYSPKMPDGLALSSTDTIIRSPVLNAPRSTQPVARFVLPTRSDDCVSVSSAAAAH